MGINNAHTNARVGNVSCVAAHDGPDREPATFRQRFRRSDAPPAEAERWTDWVSRKFAGWGELASFSVEVPDPLVWAEINRVNWPRDKPYPLAQMVLLYPAWPANPHHFRGLSVRLPDGRVVNGASDEAVAFLDRSRMWFKYAKAKTA